jgi:hypothetical protein
MRNDGDGWKWLLLAGIVFLGVELLRAVVRGWMW